MKNVFKKCTAMIVLSIVSVFLLIAEETPIENLYEYTLDNGLSVFVAENHSAPLVYIEIAVRAGAIAQTPENAGLFHLYEHMMFKGNPKYKNSQAMQRALNDMGCSNWNGTTSDNRVNYFITVPVDQFENGLEFWSYAVREPLMNPKELEDEKKVVMSEIQGYFGKPSWQSEYYLQKTLCPEAPWTLDACGPVENIQNATVAQLKEIQKKYYIPNNAALFIGGDVKPDEAIELVKKVYGNWEKGADPWATDKNQYAENPLSEPQYAVVPMDEMSPQIAQIVVSYHGPDADYNLQDTYTADAMLQVLSDPTGAFKTTVLKNKALQIPNAEYLGAGYKTTRRFGQMSFTGVVLNPADSLTDRVDSFYETLTTKALPAVQNDKSLESEKKRKILLQTINDSRAWEAETAESLLSVLSYYWCYAAKDYYMTYSDNLKKVQKADVDTLIENYVYNRNPLIMVYVNPAVYEQTKDAFDKAGYVTVSADNAFWWGK